MDIAIDRFTADCTGRNNPRVGTAVQVLLGQFSLVGVVCADDLHGSVGVGWGSAYELELVQLWVICACVGVYLDLG